MSGRAINYFILCTLVVFCLSAQIACADRVWVNTPIEIDGKFIDSESCALAMRSESTWPVIGYNNRGVFSTAALTAAGWAEGPTAGNAVPGPGGVSAATSNEGEILFAFGNGSALLLDSSGYSVLPKYVDEDHIRPSAAFDGQGRPSVLHNRSVPGNNLVVAGYTGSGWYNDIVGSPYEDYHSESYGLAYDSYGQANVAFGEPEMMFAMKGSLTNNQWQVAQMFDTPFIPERIDIAMGAGDVPWVAYSESDYLGYATYDRQLQQWVNGIIATMDDGGFDIACDSSGGIGLAFVDWEGMLNFAYNNGSDGWELSSAIAEARSPCDVSLAFDRDDNPVICYMDEFHNALSLAYDPVMIPEPGTLLMMGLGVAGLFLRRQRR